MKKQTKVTAILILIGLIAIIITICIQLNMILGFISENETTILSIFLLIVGFSLIIMGGIILRGEKKKPSALGIITFALALTSLLVSSIISYSAFSISNEAYEATKTFQLPIMNMRDTKVNYSIIQTNGTETKISMNILNYSIIESDEGVTFYVNLDINETVVNVTVDSLLVDINFNIVNEGNGIAEETRIYTYFVFTNESISDDKRIINNDSSSFANKFYPDVAIPSRLALLFSASNKGIEELLSGEEIAIIMRFECIDVATEKKIVETIWSKLRLDRDSLLRMSIEERNQLEPYIQ